MPRMRTGTPRLRAMLGGLRSVERLRWKRQHSSGNGKCISEQGRTAEFLEGSSLHTSDEKPRLRELMTLFRRRVRYELPQLPRIGGS